MKIPIHAVFAVLALAFAGQAVAQGHLEIRTTVQKEETVQSADGDEEVLIVDAETVVPGDEVIYTVSFANVSDQAAENVVITNPLPAELTYVEGSATAPDADVEFSADGGATFAGPAELVVRDESGDRQARPQEFTHIRWVMGRALAPGEHGEARFRARLN